MKIEDKDRISIEDLVIEITRRCNMKCEHCLRGQAQNIDIDLKYVDTLFKHVNYISQLTITGGEPSLRPFLINEIIKLAKKHNIQINSFYMVTNGKLVTPEFLMSIVGLYSYCDDNEISGIRVSSDQFHEKASNDNIKKLQIFSFTQIEEKNKESLIIEGKATRSLAAINRIDEKYTRKL